jgi:hypothetical protein
MLAVKLAPKVERANQNPCADQQAPTVAPVVYLITGISVGDQDPDPHVFWPPGSNSQMYGSGSGSFPFLINVF